MPSQYVADLSDFDSAGRKIVRLGELDIALLRVGDEIVAFENVCAHMGGPVGEGIVVNRIKARLDDQQRYLGEDFVPDELHLVCPWHGWEYRLPNGQCVAAPEHCLRRFPVEVSNGRVVVNVPQQDLAESS